MLKKIEPHEIIAQDWSVIAAQPAQFATCFYERLFRLSPDVAAMFGGTDMAEQGQKLAAALGLVVRHAADLDRIAPQLGALGQRHDGWGVTGAHYDLVGAALIETLAETLGRDFDAVHSAAWTTAYGAVVGHMMPA